MTDIPDVIARLGRGKSNAAFRFGNGRIRSDGAHVYSVPGSTDMVIVNNRLLPKRKAAVSPDLKPGDVQYDDEPKRRP